MNPMPKLVCQLGDTTRVIHHFGVRRLWPGESGIEWGKRFAHFAPTEPAVGGTRSYPAMQLLALTALSAARREPGVLGVPNS